MKKELLFTFYALFFLSFIGHSQTTFFEGFENTTGPSAAPATTWTLESGNWAVFDNGIGLAQRWQINNTVSTPPLVYAGSNAAYVNRELLTINTTSEDYLATPLVTIPANGQLRFFTRSFTSGNTETLYKIKIAPSTANQANPADYTTELAVYDENSLTIDTNDNVNNYNIYTEKIIDFPTALVGQQVYVAFIKSYTQSSTFLSGDRWLLDNVRISQKCLNPFALTASGILFNQANLSWNNPTGSSSWEIEIIPETDSPSGTGVVYNGTLPFTATGLTPNTTYKYYVKTLCGDGITSDWVGSSTFNTQLEPPSCGEVFSDTGGVTSDYSNNSDVTTIICPENTGETVTVTFTSFNTETIYDGLYVFNGNSINATQITSENPSGSVPGLLAGSFWGTTNPGSFTSSSPDGCLTFRFRSSASIPAPGWAANVTCGIPPSCSKPISLIKSNITTTSITLGWTNTNSASQWQILALPCNNEAPNSSTTGWITANSNPFTINGLNPNTCYKLYVRAVCTSTDFSDWSSPISGTTLIALNVCGGIFTDNGGTLSNYSNNSNTITTICPEVPGEVVTITFTNYNTESGFDGLFIYNGNSVTATQISSGSTMPNLVGAFWGTNNPGTITSTSADGCLTFRFKSNATITSSGWIANITCGQSPSCVAPVVYNFSIIDYDNALFSWTELGTATQWEVIVLPAAQPAPNATDSGTLVNTNSYHMYGLNSATLYKVYSRSICSLTEKSVWSSSNNFSTLTCYSPTFTISNVTSNSVNVNLSTTESISWEIIVQPSSMAAPTNSSNGVITTNNSYTITNLLPITQHKVYVRKNCTVNAKSNWSTGTVFTTTNSSTCPMPTSIIKNGISSTNANLSWAVGTANQWEVLLQTAETPFPPISATGTIVNTNSYNATNLTTNVPYKFYVRTICSAGYISDWSSYSFTLFPILPPIVTNTTTYTNEQLVTNVLVNNPCITISNVTSSTGTNFGSTNGIGYFTNTNPTFPLAAGIVLSTGNVNNIPGPNTSILSDGVMTWTGDSELENIIMTTTGLTMSSKNATKLEFDFTSLNEFMSFNFLFASEEYGTYQCTYADAFAFLLTDLVTGVTTNLAVVPGTSAPISVVTIRENVFNYACNSVNPDFFDTFFEGASNYLSATNFNGQTTEMSASSVIIPNHPYHIKLVIADRGDTALDSAVFIKAGSFTSGPPECYDKINLVAFVDSNNNGIQETGEVNFSYGSFVSQQNNAGPTSSINSPFGTHTIYDSNPLNSYDFSYSLDEEYTGYYSSGTTTFNDISIAVGSGTQTLYFPITLTNPYNDVTVSVVPTTPPVPGFNYTNKVVYKNLGIAPASGQISFTKDANVMINSISVPGSVSTATGFTYDFANLQPYESRFINVSMSVPAIPIVNIDDTLTNSASISTPSSDINSTNNLSNNTQIVVASYDPNDKMESHGEKIQFNQFAANDYLYYTIRFQNEGTANAISVRIEDFLDAQLDETSIRVVSASHYYYMTRIGNSITWNFNFINLPPALANEELSKGYVFFKVKLKPGFTVGDIIPNTANIFFDTNPAIVTNTFNTEFVAALNNLDFNSSNFLIYPNPANDLVQISFNTNSGNIESIVIFDVLGKVMKKVDAVNSNQTNINVSELSSGVYMVEVATENNLKQVKKLVIK